MNRNAENNAENRYKLIDVMSEVLIYKDFAHTGSLDCVLATVISLPTVFQCSRALSSFVL